MSFITDSLAKVSVITALALFAVRLLRRQSASLRHFVLVSAIVLSLIAPIVPLVMPSWHLPAFVEPSGARSSSIDRQSPVIAPLPGTTSIRPPLSTPLRRSRLTAILWITGAILSLFVMALGLLRLRRIAAACQPVRATKWNPLLIAASGQFRFRRFVDLLQSANPSILFTWGIRKPKVVLPAGADSWNEDRALVVLGHELAHIKRLDWLTQILAELLRSIYWFHPLVWLVCRRLRLEGEHACDNAVLRCGVPGPDYADHLLELARDLNSRGRVWSSALAMAQPSTIERRFEAMLNPSLNRRPLLSGQMIAIVVAAIGIAVPIATFSSSPIPKRAAKPAAEPAEVALETTIHSSATSESVAAVGQPSRPQSAQVQQRPVYTGEIISVRLKDADIRDFFQFLSDFTGRNFVVDQDVQGQVTLTLNRIPWDQALDVVLKDHHLALVEAPSGPRIGLGLGASRIELPAAVAQSYGQLTGAVVDTSMLPIPGAQVRVTGASLANPRSTITNSRGEFAFNDLQSGTYRMEISLAGFKTINIDRVNVNAGLSQSTTVRMDIAPISEEMTVTRSLSSAPSTQQLGAPPACNPTLPSAPSNAPSSGGAVQQAMLINYVSPIYPPQAQSARVEGIVVVEAVIGTDGRIMNVKQVRGEPLLAPATAALMQWCFRPTLLNGVPVETVVDITINFRLQQ